MIGPKNRPTAPVPKRWAKNSTVSTTSVIGTTTSLRLVVDHLQALDGATAREIAGVIMPSP